MIPNIAHFVFFYSKRDFLFVQYISIVSARIVNDCDVIIHYHVMPEGRFTDILKKDTRITWKHVPVIPSHIGSKEILRITHSVDYYKVLELYETGGIYLDLDTVCVRPWHHLLNCKFVAGIERVDDVVYGLCCAVFMTEKHGEFMREWKERFEDMFNPLGWGEGAVYLPYVIAQEYKDPDICTVMNPEVFLMPNWKQCEQIWQDDYDIPDSLVTLHLWHNNLITTKHMESLVNDFDWIEKNQHTLYSKIVKRLGIQ